ncbi:MAG: hypothetical protein QM496_12210, partial [Verrucomicrobiota bacterium]
MNDNGNLTMAQGTDRASSGVGIAQFFWIIGSEGGGGTGVSFALSGIRVNLRQERRKIHDNFFAASYRSSNISS